jgi:CRISPR-associated protein Csd1
MILDALVRHYDRLADDPDSGIAAYGYSRQKISFCVVLTADGKLHAIQPLIDDSSGRPRPVQMVVPGQAKPSGSGINPGFLWDNPAYLLGYTSPDTPSKAATRAGKAFAAFRDRHMALRDIIDDDAFTAVCRFLQDHDPATLEQRSDVEALQGTGFGIFTLRTENRYVHERPVVDQYWQSQLVAAEDEASGESNAVGRGMCLITGETAALARLHEPKIKGVAGGQSAGATLVSFNEKAYESFGKEQGLNAPVSEAAAFKYATALNHLLAEEKHRVQLGDTTCVFWTDRPETGAAEAVAQVMGPLGPMHAGPSGKTREVQTRGALETFLHRYAAGTADPTAAELESADAPFYVLGLSPNAARISVRFWMQCTVAELATRLARHVDRVSIFDSRAKEVVSPTCRDLLRETGREAKDIPPQLAGELTRSLVLDRPYPLSLAVSVLRRIKADQANDQRPALNAARAAALKAWLIRNHQQEIAVSLDPDRNEPPYLLGRLFAAYEKVQQDALGQSLNRTIRDSYLSSASATPGSVFPRLYRLNQHHFNKLRRDKPGLAVSREKLIGQICQGLTDFPRHLALQDQGLFAIGYYHQTQDFYTKRDSPESSTVESSDPELLTTASEES